MDVLKKRFQYQKNLPIQIFHAKKIWIFCKQIRIFQKEKYFHFGKNIGRKTWRQPMLQKSVALPCVEAGFVLGQ